MENKAQPFRKSRESGNLVAPRRVRLRRDGAERVRRSESAKASTRRETRDSISRRDFERHLEAWFADAEISLHSKQTSAMRRSLFGRLQRFLEDCRFEFLGEPEIRHFFATLKNDRTGQPLATETNATFRRVFNTFFRSLIKSGHLSSNPMDALPPIARVRLQETQPQTFGEKQLEALFAEAAESFSARRDFALLCLAIDTGLRASEIAKLTVGDINTLERTIRLAGKGGKVREVCFSPECYSALWNYWRERGIHPDEDLRLPLFVSSTNESVGQALTRSGIYQLVERLCERAGINDGKKGPHRLRHTFATMMVSNGAYPDSVQAMLGHSNPKMTQRYVSLGKADMRRQHDRHSPLANLKKSKKNK